MSQPWEDDCNYIDNYDTESSDISYRFLHAVDRVVEELRATKAQVPKKQLRVYIEHNLCGGNYYATVWVGPGQLNRISPKTEDRETILSWCNDHGLDHGFEVVK